MTRPPLPPFTRRAGLKALAAVGIGALPARAGISLATPEASGPTSSPSGRLVADRFLEFMQMVSGRMADVGVPSVAVGVVDKTTRITCGLGVTNVDAPTQASAQTLFRVASLSQLFTGSAVGSLVDAGEIALDEPVRTYLPSFRVADPQASEAVLVRHLLTHSAGWHGTLGLDPGSGHDTLARYVEGMADLPQIVPPGSHFSYNNAAVILAGHLVAETTGQAFEAAVRDLALWPLSMDASSFLASDVRNKPVAYGHVDEGGSLRVVEPWGGARAAAPVNGLFTNVDELLSFASFHADATRAKPAGYLSDTMRLRSHSAQGPGGSNGPLLLDAMGLGWMLTDVDGVDVDVHAGNDFGQSSLIAVVPSAGFAVVILTNADAGQALSYELMVKALDHFLGLRHQDPQRISLPEDGIRDVVGHYQFIDGPALTVSRTASGARLDVEVDGEAVPGLSGNLEFLAPDRARMKSGEGSVFVDFVRDGEDVAWVRHFGELASRLDR